MVGADPGFSFRGAHVHVNHDREALLAGIQCPFKGSGSYGGFLVLSEPYSFERSDTKWDKKQTHNIVDQFLGGGAPSASPPPGSATVWWHSLIHSDRLI